MHSGAASERGDIVLGWLTRVVISLTIVAIIGFDSIAILTARLGVTDDANAAAEAANAAWVDSHGNVQTAYNAAAAYAERHKESCPVKDFSVSTTGAVRLRLEGKATTLVVDHLGPMKQLADIHGIGQATTPAQ
jgi:hypothetical protein